VKSSATELANALLRLGVLDPHDPEQRALREALFADSVLYDDVKQRLLAVGYDLVQLLGHVGARLQRQSALDPLVTARNNLGLDARHVRLLVYLWLHLVYRQLKELSRDEPTQPVGRTQTLFGFEPADEAEAPSSLPMAELQAEFAELTSKVQLKGALTLLKRHGFVREEGGALTAGPAIYVLVDHERMEEFVVGLARAGVLALPGDELPPEPT
jgi:hypothetical protein